MMKGLLCVYKPRGWSSQGVVSRIRRTLGKFKLGVYVLLDEEKRTKVGHGGTLDPEAEGILIIGVGQSCRELHKSDLHDKKVLVPFPSTCCCGRRSFEEDKNRGYFEGPSSSFILTLLPYLSYFTSVSSLSDVQSSRTAGNHYGLFGHRWTSH